MTRHGRSGRDPPSPESALGLSVVLVEFREVRQDFVLRGPTHQVVAQHFVGAFRGAAAGPEIDQQTGNDRAERFES